MFYAAEAIGTALIKLAEQVGIREDEMIEFILNLKFFGHSLGAHLAGTIADFFKGKNEKYEPSLIVGMDPAGFLYNPGGIKRRCLTYRDARRVIIFHASLDGPFALGIDYMLGHEDYFLNGGSLISWLKLWSSPYAKKVISHLRVMNVVYHLLKDGGRSLTGYHYKSTKQAPYDVRTVELNLIEAMETVYPKDLKRYDEPIYVAVAFPNPGGEIFPQPNGLPPYKKKLKKLRSSTKSSTFDKGTNAKQKRKERKKAKSENWFKITFKRKIQPREETTNNVGPNSHDELHITITH